MSPDPSALPHPPRDGRTFDEPRIIAALGFGVLGPAIIWIARLKISYVLVPFACGAGWVLVLHVVTLASLAGSGLAGWIAWRMWQRAGSGGTSGGSDVERSRFLALFGLASAAFFFVVIAAEGLGNFLIDPCLTAGFRVR